MIHKLHFEIDKLHFSGLANYTFSDDLEDLDDDNILSHSSDNSNDMHISTLEGDIAYTNN